MMYNRFTCIGFTCISISYGWGNSPAMSYCKSTLIFDDTPMGYVWMNSAYILLFRVLGLWSFILGFIFLAQPLTCIIAWWFCMKDRRFRVIIKVLYIFLITVAFITICG